MKSSILKTSQVPFLTEEGVRLTGDTTQLTLSIDRRAQVRILLYVNTQNSQSLTIHVGEQAEVELIEIYDDKYVGSQLAETVTMDQAAILTQHVLILEGNGQLTTKRDIHVNRDGSYKGIYTDFGDLIHESTIKVHLNEEGAQAYWRVAAVAGHHDKKDLVLDIYNHVPHTTADMDNYGIVSGNGRLSFIGSGHIDKDARLAATHQTSKIVIFDEESVAISEPNLYIDENDVEASHASGIGKIDDEQLFYLCSRGITEAEAKRQITLGYLVPVLNYLTDETVKTRLIERMERKIVQHA